MEAPPLTLSGITAADEQTISNVLRLNFEVWSPGLDRQTYYHYQWWQLSQPWARKNLAFYALYKNGEAVSSCKLYQMTYQSHNREYRVGGLGAVYTPPDHRKKGYALELLHGMEELARERGYDALALNSDIDPDYYRKAGYEQFSALDLHLPVGDGDWLKREIKSLERQGPSQKELSKKPTYFKIRPLEMADVDETVRHYKRWLPRNQFGMKRTEEYWHFKLAREFFLHRNSSCSWPELQIITFNFGKAEGGYVIFEQAKDVLRVLEVIGPEWAIPLLWIEVMQLAQRRKMRFIRGWEGLNPPVRDYATVPRTWSKGMIKPLSTKGSADVATWTAVNPCPLLELDHF